VVALHRTAGQTAVVSADQPLFRFGLIADVQYADDDVNVDLDRHYRASRTKLADAIADFEREPLEFVVHLGDLVDHDLDNVPAMLAPMNASSLNFLQVLGNHDFSHEGGTGVYDPATVCEAIGLTDPYYSFDHRGWRFVVLNTNEVGVIATQPGTPEHAEGERLLQQVRAADRVNGNPWNGTIGRAQRAWLEDLLTDAQQQHLRTIIFAHHPVFPDHHDNLLDDVELRDWLAGFPSLTAWINGHQHQGNYGSYRDVHYLTLAGVVQTADRNAYAVASVYADRIEIAGRDREPSRTLPFVERGR
jgi:3',5'-cyclic AMP phosphodiesterase CpdA